MKMAETASIFTLLCILLLSGNFVSAISYDYSATTKCLEEPWGAQYGGGMIDNPEFDDGTNGWTAFGGAIKQGISKDGNPFIVAHNRTNSFDSFSQKVQLEKGKLYSFSAWIQISKGSEDVAVVFKIGDGKPTRGGEVTAKNGCWSLLKGGIVANVTSPADILFESKNTSVEIWADNISLQVFTAEEWRAHQEQSIDKVRKSNVKFQVTFANETAVDGAIISIGQTKSEFPIGCGMNHHIIESTDYQGWFASRFKFTTFTNEMKWYSTEKKQGVENYTIADIMVDFATENEISIRGHNIFWDNPKMQPDWVKSLPPEELRKASIERMNSVVSRYAGELIAWDVVNENVHFSFFEDKLGENASAVFYSMAHKLDPNTRLFMNEYNTIEHSNDETADAVNYKKRFEEILSLPGNEGIKAGIGLQGHFGAGQPNLVYMRSAMDILATMGLPIWLTEVDVDKGPNQTEYLEEILREGYSHPAVEGIIIFGGPEMAGFEVLTLTDKDFKSTPTGNVVDNLMNGWKSGHIEITTDGKGSSQVPLFHGDYTANVTHPYVNFTTTVNFKVTNTQERTVFIEIKA